ncbi:MAG: glycosyltransferase family 2 protein [Patescibacteria group bacterium]|nr:glycosyltransferase family 2 protein [Patescibacteria group bacterium]
MIKISVVIITKNAGQTLAKTLESVRSLADEIIVVDDNSTDSTRDIAQKFCAKIFVYPERNLGRKKNFGIEKAKNTWVLCLDADEVISEELKKEILSLDPKPSLAGWLIPYQNHFLGRKVNFGGENYAKIRLINKNFCRFEELLVHEKVVVLKGKIAKLNQKIYHYSYRGLDQMLKKFTDYALREAEQKDQKGEKSSLRKIFLYPLHMFWARFMEDKGYRDGIFRVPLDLGFAYMEFLTYFWLFVTQFLKKNKKHDRDKFKN